MVDQGKEERGRGGGATARIVGRGDPVQDWRLLANGREIPSEGYCDQPYVVKDGDGSWICVMTTGAGREGEAGQHVISLRTVDRGRTWSEPVDVEPAGGPEASYAVPLRAPSGRIFCFYNHNTDNIRRVRADTPPYEDGYCHRVDSLGYFVVKYSDDGGRSWSPKRNPIPVREMEIDRANPYGGEIRFFWNVGKAFVYDGAAWVTLHKVGRFGAGFMARSEGVLLKSEDLLVADDPGQATWETLPRGDRGLGTPPGGGPVADEQKFVVLSDGTLYCTYRSVDGHPVYTRSRDKGRTFDPPRYMRYADGRLMRHPRAANFAWKCENGKYLYWFHNHGGRDYRDRNPAWISGGVETETPEGRDILWSQPEILLYDDDPHIRISYPDLIEEDGEYYITETQKDTARVHRLDAGLLRGLWGQLENRGWTGDGLLLDEDLVGCGLPCELSMPRLPRFVKRDTGRTDHGTRDLRAGWTLEFILRLQSLRPGQVLLDSRTPEGRGLWVELSDRGQLVLSMNDGRTESGLHSDPCLLVAGREHHIGIVVDGGPRIVSFVIDGRLCDGGDHRQFGWMRFSPHLRDARGASRLTCGPDMDGTLRQVRIYDRALAISALVGRADQYARNRR